MRDPLGQHQVIGDARQRLSGISEHPFGLRDNISGADTGIMSAVDVAMGCMFCRIVEPAPGIGVLAGSSPVPGSPERRPAGMMCLEPRSLVSIQFGHSKQ